MTNLAVRILALNEDNEVLLQFRDGKCNNENDYKFCFIGGGVDEGEAVNDAAAREFVEETGIAVQQNELQFIVERRYGKTEEKRIMFFKLTRTVAWPDITMGLEGAGLAFVPYQHLNRIPSAGGTQWFFEQYPELPE